LKEKRIKKELLEVANRAAGNLMIDCRQPFYCL